MNLLFDEVAKFQASRGSPFSTEMIRRFMIDNIELPEIIEYKNIPRLAPPFPSMWFEWREEHVHSQFGLHLMSTQGSDGWDYIALGWISSKIYSKGPKLQPYALKFHVPVSGRIDFFECRSFPIKPEPHVVVRNSSMSEEEYMTIFVAAYMTRVLFAIGLLHCKNIVQIEKGGKNPNVTHRRQRSKGTKHYILDVVPARNIKRTEYEHPLKGSPQRIHFRRGHFKEYTMDKPLFGKYVGTFWWEAHVAGSKDIGEIKKDYRILPTQQ